METRVETISERRRTTRMDKNYRNINETQEWRKTTGLKTKYRSERGTIEVKRDYRSLGKERQNWRQITRLKKHERSEGKLEE